MSLNKTYVTIFFEGFGGLQHFLSNKKKIFTGTMFK